jgi:hypothetical protein
MTKPLNQMPIEIGLTMPMAFETGWLPLPFKHNDFLPATVKEIRKNGKVKIEWIHKIFGGQYHPRVVIKPEHILVECK